jgi:chorismate-pyruvate lyase
MNGPSMESLFALFPGEKVPAYDLLAGEDVPEPYRSLLVHEHHMTVTVEDYHGGPVDVRILQRRQDGMLYARKILLVHRASGKVVLCGIVRIDLAACSPAVADAIVVGQTPLGRILIENDVLRRIEPTAYLRAIPGPAPMTWFGMSDPTPLYGRLAIIHCDERPAVELLEVVRP